MNPPPKKAFGQNFLTDEETARVLVRATGLGPGFRAVEIGPGRGFLTRFLLDSGAEVLAVEKDPELPALLNQQFAGRAFSVVESDVLQVDLATLLPPPFVLVGNLPYYVSLAILAKALETAPGVISQMVFMFQKEVALRLCASPGDDDYGVPTLLCQVAHRVKMIRKVPAGSFFPKPKVDSALVHITPLPAPLLLGEQRTRFLDWAGSVFRYRRKTARNAILQAMGLDGGTVDAILAHHHVAPMARIEDLPIPTLIPLWTSLIAKTNL